METVLLITVKEFQEKYRADPDRLATKLAIEPSELRRNLILACYEEQTIGMRTPKDNLLLSIVVGIFFDPTTDSEVTVAIALDPPSAVSEEELEEVEARARFSYELSRWSRRINKRMTSIASILGLSEEVAKLNRQETRFDA